jgi:hypothetical protein
MYAKGGLGKNGGLTSNVTANGAAPTVPTN